MCREELAHCEVEKGRRRQQKNRRIPAQTNWEWKIAIFVEKWF